MSTFRVRVCSSIGRAIRFEFGVEIDCRSDDDSDVEILSSQSLNDTMSTLNTDTMTGNIPNKLFDEIMPPPTLDESISAIDIDSIDVPSQNVTMEESDFEEILPTQTFILCSDLINLDVGFIIVIICVIN